MSKPFKRAITDHRRVMLKAYGEIHAMRQRRDKIPTRRQMGEAALQAILMGSFSPTDPTAGREMLVEMLALMADAKDRNGQTKFSMTGALKRWKRLVSEHQKTERIGGVEIAKPTTAN